MPELPEVRIHAERLQESHGGATLTGFTPLSFTALKTFSPGPDVAVGEQLTSVGTRGKFILLEFPSAIFIVHLMQGGRLNPDPKASAKPRGGLCRWRFKEVDPLLLTEAGREHKAGVWVVAHPIESAEQLAHLGPEADTLTRAQLDQLLDEAKGARLHGVLRDQRRLAGLGRRLANEICWTAQLSPFAACNRIDEDGRSRLAAAIVSCVAESIDDERTRDHMARSKERVAHVHHRKGEACDRCGDVIREVSYNAYAVDYCATCQTGGKVLADNTTSKFLK
ncbi:MAG: DNA-formamidopyrimidine glycosylase family protein [Acidimicrobiales bacterium]